MGARRILGIDPGSRLTGFGVIDDEGGRQVYVASGRIETPRGAPLSVRAQVIAEGIFEVADKYAPTESSIEQVFVNCNPAATLMLGQARGVCVTALVLSGLPVAEYSALQIKQAVAGHGKAQKEQVQRMVARLLGLSGAPQSDAADALAIALTHAKRNTSVGYFGGAAASVKGGRYVLPAGRKTSWAAVAKDRIDPNSR